MTEYIKKYGFYAVLIALFLYFLGKYLYAQPKFVNGETAPDLVGQLYNGNAFQLSNLKGNYVLVDFWGSWCGPCIQETPNLRKLYDDFHGKNYNNAKGFEIVSIGIESDKSRWLNAIQRLDMHWEYHVSDFQNLKSPLAKSYGVRVIPTKFLLNTEGVIIGVNQPIEEIEKLLKTKLK
jgi:thiol-disulfide isomerase/thioredoxin